MKAKTTLFISIFFLLLLVSCSTKKDAFLNRNFHAVTTEFNILYNGQLAFDKGIDDINNKHQDNFWEQIPIEPITFEEDIRAPRFNPAVRVPGANFSSNNQQNKSTSFDRAEEKATKAIQRHSMKIYGVERNPQIDEAYLLLGKSRYYTQRFIPAIEAFNYIIANYSEASLIDETRIWKAKSNIRLDNEETAIESMLELLKKEKISDATKEKANTALAMAYQKKDSTNAVVDRLIKATITDEDVNQRARNMFVLGQIYSNNKQKDSAVNTFEKLASYKKAPFKYQLRALMALSKEANNSQEINALIKRYRDLFPVWEFRHSLGLVHYHIGTLQQKRDSVDGAVKSYKSTLLEKKLSTRLKSFTYEKLADIYFDTNKFFLASSYYDSVLSIDKEETLRIRRIQRKYNSLASLITYETLLSRNDSILKVVLLTEDERIQFFQNHIEKLKAKELENNKNSTKKVRINNNFGNDFANTTKRQRRKSKGKWYFYNQQSLSFGEAEFQRVWGSRSLIDNWRWSDSQKAIQQKRNRNQGRITSKSRNKQNNFGRYNLQDYLDQIPTETIYIDSIQDERATALYELGIIYKEQFQKDQLAIDRLERLVVSYPPKKLYLPTYNLLQELYGKQKESKGVFYKKRIVRKYPNSTYAYIISNENNPNSKEEEKRMNQLYSIAYKMYKNGEYLNAVSFIDLTIENKGISPIIPKFELLKAYCIGKYASKKEYKKSLNKVYERHPNSKEGRKANKIAKRL